MLVGADQAATAATVIGLSAAAGELIWYCAGPALPAASTTTFGVSPVLGQATGGVVPGMVQPGSAAQLVAVLRASLPSEELRPPRLKLIMSTPACPAHHSMAAMMSLAAPLPAELSTFAP